EILSDADEERQGPQDLSELWLFSTFKITGDDKFYELQCQNLELVREERNQLAHHFFCDISSRVSRADGWTCLARAGQLVHEEAPNEVAKMKAKYGYDSFKKLLAASECFEILDEPTSNGRFRTFYRLR
ncbi:MAG: hypothetical protein KIT26_02250, partial [Nitrosomonas sp.]|nr:hypothetical protein [Nitrosomonas sp.]